eukprot:SAG11_NODE_38238_length_253_cov_0.668831_1_plen_26_part_10
MGGQARVASKCLPLHSDAGKPDGPNQ